VWALGVLKALAALKERDLRNKKERDERNNPSHTTTPTYLCIYL
jgi:hypothetical protein